MKYIDTATFELRKAKRIASLVETHIKTVEAIESHKITDCAADNHVIEGYATGADNGHWIDKCLLCDFKREYWD